MKTKSLKIEELSTEQKIGMLFCARRCGKAEEFEQTLEMIRNHSLGSVQVPINDKTPEIIKAIKEAADYPILIINDMEEGYPRSNLPCIPALTLAACDNPNYYRAFAKAVVAGAKKEGYNGTWGPIVDILVNDGPCRVKRVFGDTPEKVIKATAEIAKVYKEYGFMSTGKHYPGSEDSIYDTHMTEGICHVTEEQLLNNDLVPYLELMKQGLLPSIMTGHKVFDKIDPDYPASVSKKVIDIIRSRGFNGVAFTDSLAMMGILQKYGEENIMGMCVAAGNDIILPNYRTPVDIAYGYLLQNYRDGVFSEERLNEACARVLALQAEIGAKADLIPELTEEDIQCLSDISRDAVTAITDGGVSADLGDANKKRLFAIVTPLDFKDNSPEEEVVSGAWYFPHKIANKIKEEFPNSEVVFVSEYANPMGNEKVLLAATKHDEVIFITFCNTSPYLGTDCMTRRTEALINALNTSGKVKALVHFGNPYAVKPINHIPRILLGYTAPESQNYAIEVLAGKIEAKGHLPFDIKFN
ncbi:MAG: hypothetical protein IJW79_07105 [Clostridia bacterium]|nr:hypothetical protein [Clostridia bacterium]